MRLIDADAFIEYLGLDAECSRKNNLGAIVTLEDFDRQPSASNVDRIMERLETNSMYAQGEVDPLVLLDDAIEIVKSGGIG